MSWTAPRSLLLGNAVESNTRSGQAALQLKARHGDAIIAGRQIS